MRQAILFAMCFIASVVGAVAAETYVLQGTASGAEVDCRRYRWDSDVVLHNRSDFAENVRLLNVSNGGPAQPLDAIAIAGHETTTLRLRNAQWVPAAASPLWVVLFDLPDALSAESRFEVGYDYPCIHGSPQSGAGTLGKLSFPVFHVLQPANVTKVHLGTDVAFIPSRVNVAVYNASKVVASRFHIELRQACDDSVVEIRDVTVPPDTVLQVGGLLNITSCQKNTAYGYITYVTVVADQPSLSWVSVLANEGEIRATYAAPTSSP